MNYLLHQTHSVSSEIVDDRRRLIYRKKIKCQTINSNYQWSFPSYNDTNNTPYNFSAPNTGNCSHCQYYQLTCKFLLVLETVVYMSININNSLNLAKYKSKIVTLDHIYQESCQKYKWLTINIDCSCTFLHYIHLPS